MSALDEEGVSVGVMEEDALQTAETWLVSGEEVLAESEQELMETERDGELSCAGVEYSAGSSEASLEMQSASQRAGSELAQSMPSTSVQSTPRDVCGSLPAAGPSSEEQLKNMAAALDAELLGLQDTDPSPPPPADAARKLPVPRLQPKQAAAPGSPSPTASKGSRHGSTSVVSKSSSYNALRKARGRDSQTVAEWERERVMLERDAEEARVQKKEALRRERKIKHSLEVKEKTYSQDTDLMHGKLSELSRKVQSLQTLVHAKDRENDSNSLRLKDMEAELLATRLEYWEWKDSVEMAKINTPSRQALERCEKDMAKDGPEAWPHLDAADGVPQLEAPQKRHALTMRSQSPLRLQDRPPLPGKTAHGDEGGADGGKLATSTGSSDHASAVELQYGDTTLQASGAADVSQTPPMDSPGAHRKTSASPVPPRRPNPPITQTLLVREQELFEDWERARHQQQQQQQQYPPPSHHQQYQPVPAPLPAPPQVTAWHGAPRPAPRHDSVPLSTVGTGSTQPARGPTGSAVPPPALHHSTYPYGATTDSGSTRQGSCVSTSEAVTAPAQQGSYAGSVLQGVFEDTPVGVPLPLRQKLPPPPPLAGAPGLLNAEGRDRQPSVASIGSQNFLGLPAQGGGAGPVEGSVQRRPDRPQPARRPSSSHNDSESDFEAVAPPPAPRAGYQGEGGPGGRVASGSARSDEAPPPHHTHHGQVAQYEEKGRAVDIVPPPPQGGSVRVTAYGARVEVRRGSADEAGSGAGSRRSTMKVVHSTRSRSVRDVQEQPRYASPTRCSAAAACPRSAHRKEHQQYIAPHSPARSPRRGGDRSPPRSPRRSPRRRTAERAAHPHTQPPRAAVPYPVLSGWVKGGVRYWGVAGRPSGGHYSIAIKGKFDPQHTQYTFQPPFVETAAAALRAASPTRRMQEPGMAQLVESAAAGFPLQPGTPTRSARVTDGDPSFLSTPMPVPHGTAAGAFTPTDRPRRKNSGASLASSRQSERANLVPKRQGQQDLPRRPFR